MNGKYKTVTVNGKTFYAHRLVWELVYGPIPVGHEVHHKDEDRENNHPDNLELLSKSEHSALHVRVRGGAEERHGRTEPKGRAPYVPRPMTHYKCVVCGIDAVSRKSNAVYCSKTCNSRALQQRRKVA